MDAELKVKWWHIALLVIGLVYSVVTTSVNTFGGAIQQRQQMQDEIGNLTQELTDMKANEDRINSHLEYDDRMISGLQIKVGLEAPDPPTDSKKRSKKKGE